MEEDIKEIQLFIKSIRSDLEEDAPDNFKLIQSIEHLLQAYKEQEKVIEEMKKYLDDEKFNFKCSPMCIHEDCLLECEYNYILNKVKENKE